ncbi:MAG: hypothetical protein EOO07_29530 [Chitinophagaceae bacterium]|nr:MAG: hypothetical protein EOO07_29530 [Chitinophagaceae bacterium]
MKTINYQQPEKTAFQMAAEPEVLYRTGKKLDEFKISNFERLNQKLPFSQAEWADILHISDRTLQRYIKDKKPFEGLYAEHLYQLENLAIMASDVFSTPEKVKNWLMSSKNVLGSTLDFNTLKSFWGVKLIATELGRIAHGVYI